MIDVETVRAMLNQSAVLALMVSGVLVMLGGFSRRLLRAAGRAALLAILLVIASVIVTPEWLP